MLESFSKFCLCHQQQWQTHSDDTSYRQSSVRGSCQVDLLLISRSILACLGAINATIYQKRRQFIATMLMRVFHWRYFHAPSACGSILGTIWYLFHDSKKSMNFCLLMEKSKYVVAVCTYLQKKSSLQWLTKMMIMCWNLQKDQNEANLVQMSCVPHFKMSRSTQIQRLFCTVFVLGFQCLPPQFLCICRS